MFFKFRFFIVIIFLDIVLVVPASPVFLQQLPDLRGVSGKLPKLSPGGLPGLLLLDLPGIGASVPAGARTEPPGLSNARDSRPDELRRALPLQRRHLLRPAAGPAPGQASAAAAQPAQAAAAAAAATAAAAAAAAATTK